MSDGACDLCRQVFGEEVDDVFCSEHTAEVNALAWLLAKEATYPALGYEATAEVAQACQNDAITVLHVLARRGNRTQPIDSGPWEVEPLGRFGEWEALFLVNGWRFGLGSESDESVQEVTDADLGRWVDEGNLWQPSDSGVSDAPR